MKLCSAAKNEYIQVNSIVRTVNSRVHILYVQTEKILETLSAYPEVKRIIVPENLSKTANLALKNKYIKWYVTNSPYTKNILKFFKQHNKVAWDFTVQYYNIEDILNVCEIVLVNGKILQENIEILEKFNGDVILI